MKRFLLNICLVFSLAALFAQPVFASGKGVVLNFNEVDISTMVKFISDLTGKNFVLDDRVKGKISVFSPSKLSIDEAYNVFVSVLELKGFTVLQSGKVAKIVPTAGAKQSGVALLPPGEQAPVNENYVAQVTKLDNITAQEALPFLQPMVSKDGHISAFGPGNMLLIVDSSLNIRKLQGILQTIDTERTREGAELIYLKNAAAEATAATVRQWLGGGTQSTAPGQPAAGGGAAGSVLADQRLNALLLFGNDSTKKAVREMVAKLDVVSPEASSKVNVYYLEHTDATEMAKVLDGVVKGISATASTPGTPGAAAAPQVSPFESGRVTITPDKGTNSLVIMASPNDYNNLQQIIKKLDRRSKQVFVQVLIAEVSLDKLRDVGVEAAALGGYVDKNLSVIGMADPYSALASMLTTIKSASDAGISNNNLKLQSPANVMATLHALDKNGVVNILSTPNILTSDNKEAEINVGENVPFKGANTITGQLSTTSVDRKDIGINLKIKPQISEGEYLRMDISQEISAVKKDKGDAVDIVTTKRAAKTSVVVKDRETVVIGGLIQDSEEETVKKVPFLGDIPGLGWLFKTKYKSRSKTNLMILVTPRIVRDAVELAEVSRGRQELFNATPDSSEPLDVRKELSGK